MTAVSIHPDRHLRGPRKQLPHEPTIAIYLFLWPINSATTALPHLSLAKIVAAALALAAKMDSSLHLSRARVICFGTQSARCQALRRNHLTGGTHPVLGIEAGATLIITPCFLPSGVRSLKFQLCLIAYGCAAGYVLIPSFSHSALIGTAVGVVLSLSLGARRRPVVKAILASTLAYLAGSFASLAQRKQGVLDG